MFIILRQNFDGRLHNEYYRDWNNAKIALDKAVKRCCDSLNGKVTKEIDTFDASRGVPVYEKMAAFPNNEYSVWTLVYGFFEDDFMT